MIADMISNKNLHPELTELFITGRKFIISLVFMAQSYFQVLKNVRLNTTHFFIIKIPYRQELQQIAIIHKSNIEFDKFKRLYRNYAAQSYSFLVIDGTLPSGNHYVFERIIMERNHDHR